MNKINKQGKPKYNAWQNSVYVMKGAWTRDKAPLFIILAQIILSVFASTLGIFLPKSVVGQITGGEEQKIALARALYKDAPFVILDEPTAALDPIAEYEVYSKFNEIVGDKTVVYISHRLSSCRFCDDIAVLHEGGLIQQGSHEELIAEVGSK